MSAPQPTSLPRWSEVVKRFLLIFLPLAFFFGSITYLFYYKDVDTALHSVKKAESFKVNAQMRLLTSKFKSIITDLEFLALQSELSDYLTNNSDTPLKDLAQVLQQFSSIKRIYNEIQLINEDGLEVIRITTTDGAVSIAPPEKLQNKTWHAYFSETIKLPKRSVFISPFDLKSRNHHDT